MHFIRELVYQGGPLDGLVETARCDPDEPIAELVTVSLTIDHFYDLDKSCNEEDDGQQRLLYRYASGERDAYHRQMVEETRELIRYIVLGCNVSSIAVLSGKPECKVREARRALGRGFGAKNAAELRQVLLDLGMGSAVEKLTEDELAMLRRDRELRAQEGPIVVAVPRPTSQQYNPSPRQALDSAN